MEKHIYNEQTGISYTLHGDYYLPDLTTTKKALELAYMDKDTYGILNITERRCTSIC